MDATENEKENESGQSQIHETALTKKLTVLELRTRWEKNKSKGRTGRVFSF